MNLLLERLLSLSETSNFHTSCVNPSGSTKTRLFRFISNPKTFLVYVSDCVDEVSPLLDLDNIAPFLETIFPKSPFLRSGNRLWSETETKRCIFIWFSCFGGRRISQEQLQRDSPKQASRIGPAVCFGGTAGCQTRLNLNVWNLRVSLIVQSKQHRRPPATNYISYCPALLCRLRRTSARIRSRLRLLRLHLSVLSPTKRQGRFKTLQVGSGCFFCPAGRRV